MSHSNADKHIRLISSNVQIYNRKMYPQHIKYFVNHITISKKILLPTDGKDHAWPFP